MALVGLAALTAGCATRQSPLMRSVMLLDTTAPRESALVVFVRDSNPCDGGDPFRVVDDNGRFLGELVPSSKFAVRMEPGHHAFFTWQPHGDLPRDLYPDANQVGALSAELLPGKTYTVDVSIKNPTHEVRKTCFGYLFLGCTSSIPPRPRWPRCSTGRAVHPRPGQGASRARAGPHRRERAHHARAAEAESLAPAGPDGVEGQPLLLSS